MNVVDRIKEPYDRIMEMRDQQTELARKAVESQEPVFAGVWMPTDEKLYLVSQSTLDAMK